MGRSGALSVLQQLRIWTLVVLALFYRDSQNHCCLAYSISPRGGITAPTSRPPTLTRTRASLWHAATVGVRGRE
ncbi:unnamed protein product, partial [Ectocarpus sp. 12 AP-2014]